MSNGDIVRRKGQLLGKKFCERSGAEKKDHFIWPFRRQSSLLVARAVTSYMSGDSNEELAIFTEALRIGRQERDAYLDRACGGDIELRSKIAALLRAHDRLGKFLEDPPIEDG